MLRSISFRFYQRIISVVLILSLLIAPEFGYAQSAFMATLPEPGMMVSSSSAFVPVLVKGLVVYPDKPLNFDFIVDSGNDSADQAVIKEQSERIARYFLAAVTVPEDQLWVNLSPYEKDRIIENDLGTTVLGRDMLAQDYVLKQLTASLIYPEQGLGKEFWAKIYQQAQEEFGTTNIPVDTFNKVWIMPGKAEIFEKDNAVYVTNARLKVMLDADHQAQQSNFAGVDDRTKDLLRTIIIPALEKEVNEGKNFAVIRQVYHAAILAKWYRELIQNTFLSNAYVGKNRVEGVTSDEKMLKEQIYQRYIAAYKKGVFDYIKEETNPATGEALPKKYFSGGIEDFAMKNVPLTRTTDASMLSKVVGKVFSVLLGIRPSDSLRQGIKGGDIFDAIYRYDFDSMKKLLLADRSVMTAMNSTGLTPLQEALREVADMNTSQSYLTTQLASDTEKVRRVLALKKMIHFLLSIGADVNSSEINFFGGVRKGYAALHYVAAWGDLETLGLILNKVKNVDFKDEDGTTPLMIAAQWGYVHVVQALIKKGADVNLRDDMGTALTRAQEAKHDQVVQILKAAGAKTDSAMLESGNDAAMGDIQVTSLALSANADSSMINEVVHWIGETPLHLMLVVVAVGFGISRMRSIYHWSKSMWERHTLAGAVWGFLRDPGPGVGDCAMSIVDPSALNDAIQLIQNNAWTIVGAGSSLSIAVGMARAWWLTSTVKGNIRRVYTGHNAGLVWLIKNGSFESEAFVESYMRRHNVSFSEEMLMALADIKNGRFRGSRNKAIAWVLKEFLLLERGDVKDLLSRLGASLLDLEQFDAQENALHLIREKSPAEHHELIKSDHVEEVMKLIKDGKGFFVISRSEVEAHEGIMAADGLTWGDTEGSPSHFEIVGYSKEEKRVNSTPNIDSAMADVQSTLSALSANIPDAAQSKDLGGIDIKNIDLTHKVGGVKIKFNDDAVRAVLQNGFNGFTPVIINITPIQSPLLILGWNKAEASGA